VLTFWRPFARSLFYRKHEARRFDPETIVRRNKT
jgi:hypothetical protein